MAMEVYRYKYVGGDFSTIQMEVPMPVAFLLFDCPIEIAVEITADVNSKIDLDYYMKLKGYVFDSVVPPTP